MIWKLKKQVEQWRLKLARLTQCVGIDNTNTYCHPLTLSVPVATISVVTVSVAVVLSLLLKRLVLTGYTKRRVNTKRLYSA